MFKNRPGTIPELMQVITDICNLTDVPTLQRSFENRKQRVTLYFKSHCFIALGEEILLQPTGHTYFTPLRKLRFQFLKITNLTFKSDI
jgi:hypothetical protein